MTHKYNARAKKAEKKNNTVEISLDALQKGEQFSDNWHSRQRSGH